MPRPLTIALLQINPTGTLDGNLAKGILACRRAAELGADIALFPEMWSNGYALHGRPVEDWTAEAVDVDGDFVSAFGELARELNMAIGVTLPERYEGGPRNTLVLFDRFGERQLTYAKVHTCDFDVERHLTPGREFPVCVFDTAVGPGEDGSRDMCLLQADGTEGVFVAKLDLDQLRKYREYEVQGNAYRHPELYGMLCSGAVDPPFVRPDRRVVPMPERG